MTSKTIYETKLSYQFVSVEDWYQYSTHVYSMCECVFFFGFMSHATTIMKNVWEYYVCCAF